MPETYTQFKDRLYEERGPHCEVCTKYVPREEIQLHHVLHQAQHPHIRQDEDNVVQVCWVCHRLDSVAYREGEGSELRRLLIRKKGQEWFERLRLKGQVSHA